MNNTLHIFKMVLALCMTILIACGCTESLATYTVAPDIPFPLSEPGPYYTGLIEEYNAVDESRNDREVYLRIRYPAKDETNALNQLNAPANKHDAPYPLILTDYDTGGTILDDHLATHGFVMVEVEGDYPGESDISDDDSFGFNVHLLDNWRDLLFVLDQLTNNPPKGLNGVIDVDHTGVVGYSYGGQRTLAVSGARIDPEFYLEICRDASSIEPPLSDHLYSYYCNLASRWEDFEANAGSEMTASADGLWQPLTDERIRAVMPMAPEGSFFFGEHGLAAVNRPTMIIAGTEDEFLGTDMYNLENVYIFEHLRIPDRYLISFIEQTHLGMTKGEQASRIKHFVTAFFGDHLKGREDFAEYYSEDYVAQFDDLYWGVYEK